MKRLCIMTMAACLALAPAVAQQAEKTSPAAEQSATGNWYIEAGGGAQLFFGADAARLDFGRRITPSLNLTVGRWFNPVWGTRLRVGGWSLNGFSTSQPNDPVSNHVAVRPDGSYRYYLRYMDAHADLQLSLANLIGGCDPQRGWDIIPAVGIGYTQTFAYKGTPAVSTLSTHFSLMGKWKLPKGFDLNMEVFTSVLPDRFDGRLTARSYEPTLGVNIGLTYNFGRASGTAKSIAATRTMAQETAPVVSAYDESKLLDDVRRVVREEMEEQSDKRRDTVTVVREVERPQTVQTSVRLASIRFGAGQTVPFAGQEVQLANVVEFMHGNPEARLLIEGYADDETGSREYNLQLSAQRAAAVRDLLQSQYGIASERLTLKAYGADVQVYEKSAWNRVVIIKTVE